MAATVPTEHEEDETLRRDFINLDDLASSTEISLDNSEEEIECKCNPIASYAPRGYFPQLTHLFSATIRRLSAEFGGIPQIPLLRIGNNLLTLTEIHGTPGLVGVYLSFTMYYTSGIFGSSKHLPYEAHVIVVRSDHTHICFTMHDEMSHTIETCANIDTDKQVVLLVRGADECVTFLETHRALKNLYYVAGWTSWALKGMCACSHAPGKLGFEVMSQYEYIACLINEFLPADNKMRRENCQTVQQLYTSIGRFRTIAPPPLQ
jgi:hypothetical protein